MNGKVDYAVGLYMQTHLRERSLQKSDVALNKWLRTLSHEEMMEYMVRTTEIDRQQSDLYKLLGPDV